MHMQFGFRQSSYKVIEFHKLQNYLPITPKCVFWNASGYFNPVIISEHFGYRKPDKRLFLAALTDMGLNASEVVYVGNDMYRDVYGAQSLGVKTVFFKSNQGTQEKEGVKADYIIYNFSELHNAIRFFERR